MGIKFVTPWQLGQKREEIGERRRDGQKGRVRAFIIELLSSNSLSEGHINQLI